MPDIRPDNPALPNIRPNPMIRLSLRQVGYDILKDVDAPQEDLLVQELVVVVQQLGRVRHRREPDGRDTKGSQVP